jgi:hypothetical protein
MDTGTGDVIKLCREAGLAEPEFTLTDGFVTTIQRKPELAFKAVGGQVEAPSWHQAGNRLKSFVNAGKIARSRN